MLYNFFNYIFGLKIQEFIALVFPLYVRLSNNSIYKNYLLKYWFKYIYIDFTQYLNPKLSFSHPTSKIICHPYDNFSALLIYFLYEKLTSIFLLSIINY